MAQLQWICASHKELVMFGAALATPARRQPAVNDVIQKKKADDQPFS